MAAPQGILDPDDVEGYVPVDQSQYDEMKTGLTAAPDATQKFALACAYKEQGYNPTDLLVAAYLSGLSPAATVPAVPVGAGNMVGTRLGQPWADGVTGARAGRDPSSDVKPGNYSAPTQAGGIARRAGLLKPRS